MRYKFLVLIHLYIIVICVFYYVNKHMVLEIKKPSLDGQNWKNNLLKIPREINMKVNSVEQFEEAVMRRHPNLPPYITMTKKFRVAVPNVVSIRWNGIVYQESWREYSKFLLYSAHFDARPKKSGLVVQILTLYDGEKEIKAPLKYHCRFWFENDTKPFYVPSRIVVLSRLWPFSSSYLNPYSLTCPVPKSQNSSQFPIAVSLAKILSKKPSNMLKIFGSPDGKKTYKSLRTNLTIAICGKALFYYNEDFSHRLIEWIEVMKLLGISKIFLYKMPCHRNVEKVLEFYEKTGFVSLVTFYYPPPYVQEGTFQRIWTLHNRNAYRGAQHIYINDCLLRNKDNYDYLGFFDSDEIPLLKKHHNLQDFLQSVLRSNPSKKIGAIFLKWKHFYTDFKPKGAAKTISDRFYILQHNTRTKLNSVNAPIMETTGKTIYDTNLVMWAGIHRPINFLTGEAILYRVKREIAYTAHYGNHKCRSNCSKENLETENTLLRYKDEIIDNVNNVCNILNL